MHGETNGERAGNPREAPIACSVDIVLLTLGEEALRVALVERECEPFQGVPALPGGRIHSRQDGDAEAAARRVLRERTGIEPAFLEQLAAFSGRGRDPRGWSLTVAFYALAGPEAGTGTPRPGLVFADAGSVGSLPFDHGAIVRSALERVRAKSSYSSLPTHLCGEVFTLPGLQRAWEIALGETINKVSFRRKMAELDILEPVEGARAAAGAWRPAQLYRLRRQYLRTLSTTDRGINPG